MRFASWLVVLVACGGDKETEETGPTTEPTTEVTNETEGTTSTTDTGGGLPPEPIIPSYFSLDASFGVDAEGRISAVTIDGYGEQAPILVLYIGDVDWAPGDWADEDNLCVATFDVTGATPGGTWVAEHGQYAGWDMPADLVLLDDGGCNIDPAYDLTAVAASLAWQIGVGPLNDYLGYYYGTYTYDGISLFFGGYAGSPLITAPDEENQTMWVNTAYAVDPATMTVTLDANGYASYADAAYISVSGGGVTPAWYNLVWYGVVGPYAL